MTVLGGCNLSDLTVTWGGERHNKTYCPGGQGAGRGVAKKWRSRLSVVAADELGDYNLRCGW